MSRARASRRTALAWIVACALAAAPPAAAHVGSPDTWFEGPAGPYPIRVVVRAPGVIPGLAEIEVRVLDGVASRVTVQPFAWNAGAGGAPPPDVATPVPGDPRLYHVNLWLMASTSYGVHVSVAGDRGAGTAIVPVQAVATRRLGMDPKLGAILAVLGLFLFVGLITVVGAAVGDSTVPPGEQPGPARAARARLVMGVTAIVLALGLVAGRAWWNDVDHAYATGLFRPLHATATVADSAGAPWLRFAIDDPRWRGREWTPLIADHGKLMHLFLIREDLGAIAHLHPVPLDSSNFVTRLPPLPGGRFRVYADIVHESGFSQTLTASLEWGDRARDAASPYAASDPDDAWSEGGGSDARSAAPSVDVAGATVIWERGAEPMVAGREHPLRFRVTRADGSPALLEPYLGMVAHAVVARADGSVFAHLHPIGTVSMAAQMALAMRTPADSVAGTLGRRLAAAEHAGHAMAMDPASGAAPASPGAFSIPYAFPKPGRYRLWVQVRLDGTVRTAAFDADVAPAATPS